MMMTSTGEALCDSGFGARGRAWQRNQMDYPTIKHVQDTPVVDFEKLTKDGDSTDIDFMVSVYHHLVNSLSIDELCEKFNKLPCKDWDSEKAYGISEKQAEWLEKHGLEFGDTWNSYNGESCLSQTLQGCNIMVTGDALEYPSYVLIQLHQGADVRGGYTDAKLFKIECEYFTTNPTVYGDIDGVQVETSYDGYSLTDENGNAVPVKADSIINLYTIE